VEGLLKMEGRACGGRNRDLVTGWVELAFPPLERARAGFHCPAPKMPIAYRTRANRLFNRLISGKLHDDKYETLRNWSCNPLEMSHLQTFQQIVCLIQKSVVTLHHENGK
jgi:hypothetical protein